VGNGALKKARITDGFIILNANDAPMRTVADLQEAVKSASTSKDPVLYIKGIYPTGKKAYFVVELTEE
jgi:S1-C subfamily serine protease